MLTGRRLFRRKNEMDTLLSVATGPIPAPSSIAPNVPAALDAIVGRCLARDLGARYASARELGRDLTQFLQSEPEATSMADLSEWLAPLLVSERTERGELLKTAFEVGLHDAQTAALASEDPTEIESSGVRGTPRLLAAQTPIVRVEGARSSRRGLVIAGALVALLGAGAGVLWSSTMADPAVSPVSPTPIPASDPDASPTPSPSPSPNPDAIANPDRDPDAHRDPNPDTTPTPSPTPMGTTSTMTGRRTRSAEPAGEGALSVAGRCWAQVYAGTRLLGQSPAQFPLPAGRHRLRVVPRGAGTGYTVGVRISAGEVTRIAVRCE
jgi:serine/threonine-protein kinase